MSKIPRAYRPITILSIKVEIDEIILSYPNAGRPFGPLGSKSDRLISPRTCGRRTESGVQITESGFPIIFYNQNIIILTPFYDRAVDRIIPGVIKNPYRRKILKITSYRVILPLRTIETSG